MQETGTEYTLLNMFYDGGGFMYPLVLCSLFGLGVTLNWPQMGHGWPQMKMQMSIVLYPCSSVPNLWQTICRTSCPALPRVMNSGRCHSRR